MITDRELKLAQEIATVAHQDQYRRDGVTPYIEHPKAVAEGVHGPRLKAVAWLHDVLEDCDVSFDDLLDQRVSYEVARSVLLLTKQPGQSYDDYLEALSKDSAAREVKIADMVANLSDAPTPKQVAKYSKGLKFLLARRGMACTGDAANVGISKVTGDDTYVKIDVCTESFGAIRLDISSGEFFRALFGESDAVANVSTVTPGREPYISRCVDHGEDS